MTTQHTPEPWVIDETDFDIVAITDDLNVYVNGAFDSISKPDLRRIVACVNACADADTETLVAMANGEMTGSELWELPKVKAERDHLAAQVSELLAAAKPFIEIAVAIEHANGNAARPDDTPVWSVNSSTLNLGHFRSITRAGVK